MLHPIHDIHLARAHGGEGGSILRHDENLGASAARNTGIRQARGRFLAFLDDDDEWMPDFLEKMTRAVLAAPPEVGVVHCGIRFVDAAGNILRKAIPKIQGDIHSLLLRGEKPCGITGIARKEVIVAAGLFDEELLSGQDWDLWLRVSRFCQFTVLPDVLASVRIHSERISADYRRLIAGRTLMVQKYHEEFAKDPAVLCIHLKRLAKLHALNGTWPLAWRWAAEVERISHWEYFKFLGWLLLEYPWIRIFSPEGKFKRT